MKTLPYRRYLLIYAQRNTSAGRSDSKTTRSTVHCCLEVNSHCIPRNGSRNALCVLPSNSIASLMCKNQVVLATPTAFKLIQSSEFLTLFVFLCRLAEEIYNQVQQMENILLKNKKSFTKHLMNATRNPWRPLEHRPGTKNYQQDGPVDDDFDEENDDIRGDGQETCSRPLKHSYVKRLRASPVEVKSWVNQTTKDSTNSPEQFT